MQRQAKWKHWPVLAAGVILIAALLFLSHKLQKSNVNYTYTADIGGALTAVMITIATYDEWERRQERKRYTPAEKMAVKRIQDEIYELLYDFAFFLNLRFQPRSRSAVAAKKTRRAPDKLDARVAEQIAESEPAIRENLLATSSKALSSPSYDKQTSGEARQLIEQVEDTVEQIDLTISTYGYSFTPELHKWALDLREKLSQTVVGKPPVLDLRFTPGNKEAKKLTKAESKALSEIVKEVLLCAKKAKNVKITD
jgi:hypothetical protein